MTNVELVLFFGPPFTGKTSYFYKHYVKTHHRIAASEFYDQDGRHNLRTVILNAIEFLARGNNVVVDDENWYKATRKSYTTLVKKRVDNCKLSIVQFLPNVTFGYEQCLWMREWLMVEWTMKDKSHKKRLKKISITEEKLDCWFSKHRSISSTMNPPEFPVLTNNFSLLTTRPDFVCKTSYKFSLPALFVQWDAIVDSDTNNLKCEDGTVHFLNEWMNNNNYGRILLLGSKMKNDQEIIDEKVKLLLSNLSSKISYPIYFTFVDVKHQPDKFCKFPRPGTIAFLQKYHTIKLDHKNTAYVYMTDDHYKTASSVGIRTIKVEKLLSNPKMVSAIFCGEVTESLPFLKNLQEIHFDSRKNEADSTSGQMPDCEGSEEPTIPFLLRARESACGLVWKYCYGKVNGISFKDKLVLERYQTQYALAAQPASSPEKFTEKNLASSSAIVNREQHAKNTSVSLKKVNIRDYTLENINLKDVAETPGRYRAGIICKEKIHNFNTQLMTDQLKITSNCLGSSDVSYNVHAVLTKFQGIASAQCSCPDSAGKVGRCKHVIGLLLYFQDRYQNRIAAKSFQSPTPQEKIRISSSEKETSINNTNSRTDHTMYIMSVEELVETAQEILSKKYSTQRPPDQNQQQQIQENAGSFNDNSSLGSPRQITGSPERSIKRTSTSDDLEELLFGEFKDKNVERKKKCPGHLPSFVEDTPPEEQPKTITDGTWDTSRVATVIIPDSLVPETVSLVPETIQSASTESLTRDASFTTPRNHSGNMGNLKANGSFEDFLDEIL